MYPFTAVTHVLLYSSTIDNVLFTAVGAVVIMYPFTAVPHVLLYSSTIDNVLFTAVGRQMSGFEPSLRCFCAFFSLFC